MPSFKGNRGHLMQHWPLCKMLEVADSNDVTGLNLIDAYAMAPLATENKFKDAKFKSAENSLPNLGNSAVAYGQAWHQLTSGHCPKPLEGCPSSAAFVEQVWKGDFSMLLCETDQATCTEIEHWLQCVRESGRCKDPELFCDDWRKRFKKGLPSPVDAGLADGSLTLVLFDPDKYDPNWNVPKPSPRRLYPEDLELAAQAMESLEGGILIQLSTYSSKDAPKKDVIESVRQILTPNKFKQLAVVHAGRNMMSLVYARDVSWAAELTDLPGRFNEWLRQRSRPGR